MENLHARRNQWRSKGVGGNWRHAPRGTGPLGCISTLLQSFKNAFLSKNLDENMLKNAYFLEKNL